MGSEGDKRLTGTRTSCVHSFPDPITGTQLVAVNVLRKDFLSF
jgi:hypothetical protein